MAAELVWPGARMALADYLASVDLGELAVRVRALPNSNPELAVLDSIHADYGLDVYSPSEHERQVINGWRDVIHSPQTKRAYAELGPWNAEQFVAELAVAAAQKED